MSDHDALLAAIVEHPDEDTPRLMFADWLDEHAGALADPVGARARAAFVRSDIAMSLLDEYDPARLRWELIEKPRHETEPWAAGALPPLAAGLAFDRTPLFRRGFPWAVTVRSGERHIPHPPTGAFPIERVAYSLCGYFGLDQLGAAPWRGRLRELAFERGNTSSFGMGRLTALDGLGALERVAFFRRAVHTTDVPALAAWPVFSRLTELTVTDAPVGPELLLAIARAAGTALRNLTLIGCRVTAGAVGELVQSEAMVRLGTLALGGDRTNAPGKFRALARAPRGAALRALDLNGEAPNKAGVEALAASALAPQLRRLGLAHCNLNAERTALLASGPFDDLRDLALNINPVGNDGVIALAQSPHFAGLRVLDLGYTQVGDDGIRAILDSPWADGLVFLNVVGSPASAETKEALKARMGDRVRL